MNSDTDKGLTYQQAGVSYELMDPHKRESLLAAIQTDHHAQRFGFKVVERTRGESVTLLETPWGYIGLVVEGLGTKNLVADELLNIAINIGGPKNTYYDCVAQCNVAMALNDLITLGVRPVMYGQYLAVGDSKWFGDEKRRRDLIDGTKKACDMGRCVWIGGETPTLMGIIIPTTIDLAGATFGIIPQKNQLIDPANIKAGDAIVVVESSGIHANGLTLARNIRPKLPGGFLTRLPSSDARYGEVLLTPTRIYVEFMEKCMDDGVEIHYAVNVTGHGFRKFMRPVQPFTYVIDELPTQLPIFDFIQEHGPVSDEVAYGTFNMGAGFALYVPESEVQNVIGAAYHCGFRAFRAGYIEEGEKKVVITPKNLVFKEDTMQLR